MIFYRFLNKLIETLYIPSLSIFYSIYEISLILTQLSILVISQIKSIIS